MSNYTTRLRYICEVESGLGKSVGYNGIDNVISTARPKIFDFDYPIFDEEYRSVLETKILKHYYTREICTDAYGLWKLWLNNRLNEIMPYYNQLYKSELLEFNPLYDVDYQQKRVGSGTQDKTETVITEDTTDTTINEKNVIVNDSTNTYDVYNDITDTGGNTTRDAYSKTPQGTLSNVEENTYLTEYRKVTGENEGKRIEDNLTTVTLDNDATNTRTGNNKVELHGSNNVVANLRNTDEYLIHVSGKQGGTTYAKMLTDYRKTFLNIDMLIIEELSDLFMNLW